MQRAALGGRRCRAPPVQARRCAAAMQLPHLLLLRLAHVHLHRFAYDNHPHPPQSSTHPSSTNHLIIILPSFFPHSFNQSSPSSPPITPPHLLLLRLVRVHLLGLHRLQLLQLLLGRGERRDQRLRNACAGGVGRVHDEVREHAHAKRLAPATTHGVGVRVQQLSRSSAAARTWGQRPCAHAQHGWQLLQLLQRRLVVSLVALVRRHVLLVLLLLPPLVHGLQLVVQVLQLLAEERRLRLAERRRCGGGACGASKGWAHTCDCCALRMWDVVGRGMRAEPLQGWCMAPSLAPL